MKSEIVPLRDLVTRVAVLERDVAALTQALDRKDSRAWSARGNLVNGLFLIAGTVLGAVLTYLLNRSAGSR